MPDGFVVRDRSAVIDAPVERLFALSTSVPLVRRTLGFTPVDGVTAGHVEMGSRVRWKGLLFGVLPVFHLTLITKFEAPHVGVSGNTVAFFQDSQEAGRFAFFQHDHHFTETSVGTVLQDEVRFRLPFAWAGDLVARYVMEPYVRKLVRERFALLRQVAESEEWHAYVPPSS